MCGKYNRYTQGQQLRKFPDLNTCLLLEGKLEIMKNSSDAITMLKKLRMLYVLDTNENVMCVFHCSLGFLFLF